MENEHLSPEDIRGYIEGDPGIRPGRVEDHLDQCPDLVRRPALVVKVSRRAAAGEDPPAKASISCTLVA